MTQFLFSYSPIAVLVPHQQALHRLGIKFLVHRGCACQRALAFWQFLYVREVLIDKLIISSDNDNKNNYFYVLTDSPFHIIHRQTYPLFFAIISFANKLELSDLIATFAANTYRT